MQESDQAFQFEEVSGLKVNARQSSMTSAFGGSIVTFSVIVFRFLNLFCFQLALFFLSLPLCFLCPTRFGGDTL
jgi:hypothetical protein